MFYITPFKCSSRGPNWGVFKGNRWNSSTYFILQLEFTFPFSECLSGRTIARGFVSEESSSRTRVDMLKEPKLFPHGAAEHCSEKMREAWREIIVNTLKYILCIAFSMFSSIKKQVFLACPANETWQSVVSVQREAPWWGVFVFPQWWCKVISAEHSA